MAAIATAWLGPVTPDERAGLLTAAAAATTFAAMQPGPRRRDERPATESPPTYNIEPVEDLAALIAAW